MGRPFARERNAPVVETLRELAARLEVEGVAHRPRAYRRAADTIAQLDRSLDEIREAEGRRGLEALSGIGPRIAGLVCDLLDQGHSGELERLRTKTPVDVMGLLALDGVGPRTIRQLWDALGVRTLEDLEEALREGRVADLPGFGPRRVERLVRAVELARRGRRRVPRRQALAVATRLRDELTALPGVSACEIAGSLRRGAATVGDVDLVVATRDASAVADRLLSHDDVVFAYSRGPRRVSVRLAEGVDVDAHPVDPQAFGSTLLFFTGSRAHTLALRRLALAQGLRLGERGLFRGRRRIAGRDEAGIYEALALPFIPPERRRGEAEIRAALRGRARERTGPRA